jgi:hypothetical protein
MQNTEIIQSIIANAIVTTARLANELSIQTKGEFLIPEEDYIHIVKDFQAVLAKRIMPLKTKTDLEEESRKYISQLLANHKEKEDDRSGTAVDGEDKEILSSGEGQT